MYGPMRRFACCALFSLPVGQAASPGPDEYLPPELPWTGASESLQLAADHALATPLGTQWPDGDAFLRRNAFLAALSRGRRAGTVAAVYWQDRRRAGDLAGDRGSWRGPRCGGRGGVRPARRICPSGYSCRRNRREGCGLMLLRDMTVLGTERALLDKAVFLFIPILNADGH